MKFFFDQNFPYRLAEFLKSLLATEGHIATHLNDMFDPSTPDETWLSALASQSDWIVITGDTRIKRNPAIRAIWEATRLPTFFLEDGWPRKDIIEFSWQFLRRWQQIVDLAARAKPGDACGIPFGRSLSVVPLAKPRPRKSGS